MEMVDFFLQKKKWKDHSSRLVDVTWRSGRFGQQRETTRNDHTTHLVLSFLPILIPNPLFCKTNVYGDLSAKWVQ